MEDAPTQESDPKNSPEWEEFDDIENIRETFGESAIITPLPNDDPYHSLEYEISPPEATD